MINPEIKEYDDGSVSYAWHNDISDLHREDGPAFLSWYKCGHPKSELWFFNKRFHRCDGPAVQHWDEYGRLKVEEWCINGHHHRWDGPAWITYTTHDEYWYIDGMNISIQAREIIESMKLGYWREWIDEDRFLFKILIWSSIHV